jgi:hypothetical protein
LYLLYVDESGDPKGSSPSSPRHFILSGVALHEEDVFPFGQSIDAIMKSLFPKEHHLLELHATDVWAGRKLWSRYTDVDRHALLNSVFSHMGSWVSPAGRTPKYFSVAVHKPSNKGKPVLELAHEELLKRFDSSLSRLHLQGDSHRSLVICDESSYEKLLQNLVTKWKSGGTRIGRLHSLVEVPLYIDSKSSRLVQVADFVSWAVFQYYEHLSTDFIQLINDRFDSDGGVQHGLTHLTGRHGRCKCVPCVSRRSHILSLSVTAHPI